VSPKARIILGSNTRVVDLGEPVSLADEVRFSGRDPSYFGAPPALARPLELPGFSGRVTRGASCNCSTLTLTPHAHGTHTECVAHLTREPLDAWRVVPAGWMACELVSVSPRAAADGLQGESTDPAPHPADRLITRRALEQAWPVHPLVPPRALVVRTMSAAPSARDDAPPPTRDDAPLPAYLTREAAQLLVERGIEHLVVDLPSLDRLADEGRLSAHRVFFGLPPGCTELARAARAACTVTELAHVPGVLADGSYLLQIQVPALAGDAVPSRPLVYRLSQEPEPLAAAQPGPGR